MIFHWKLAQLPLVAHTRSALGVFSRHAITRHAIALYAFALYAIILHPGLSIALGAVPVMAADATDVTSKVASAVKVASPSRV